jgi:hypothetical protein
MFPSNKKIIKNIDGLESKIQIGRLSIDLLQEAVWLLLLRDEMQGPIQYYSYSLTIPKSIPIYRISDFESFEGYRTWGGSAGYPLGVSSGNTDIFYQIITDSVTIKEGDFIYPKDVSDAAKYYSVEILKNAESSFKSGCLSQPIPKHIMDDFITDGAIPSSNKKNLMGVVQDLNSKIEKLKTKGCL